MDKICRQNLSTKKGDKRLNMYLVEALKKGDKRLNMYLIEALPARRHGMDGARLSIPGTSKLREFVLSDIIDKI